MNKDMADNVVLLGLSIKQRMNKQRIKKEIKQIKKRIEKETNKITKIDRGNKFNRKRQLVQLDDLQVRLMLLPTEGLGISL